MPNLPILVTVILTYFHAHDWASDFLFRETSQEEETRNVFYLSHYFYWSDTFENFIVQDSNKKVPFVIAAYFFLCKIRVSQSVLLVNRVF